MLKTINSPDEILAIIQETKVGIGPLPEATVLLPSAIAHQLRSSTGGLSGITFLSAFETASLVLLANGEYIGTVADRYLAPMIEALVSSHQLEGKLCYFKIDQLRTGAGYAEALASTILEMDSAGLTPEDLLEGSKHAAKDHGPTAARLKDLATIWDTLASPTPFNRFISSFRVLARASEILLKYPYLYPFRGRTIGFIDERTPNTVLKFFSTIPRLIVIYFRAFPQRKKMLARLEYAKTVLRIADDAAGMSGRITISGSASSATEVSKEIDILKRRLFHPLGTILDMPQRSEGSDGTVHLEEHAGVEEELQSAVEWVSRQVLEHNIPLEKIAILLPEIDPYAAMLFERLSSLTDSGLFPIYVTGGIPAKAQADGSRLNILLEALEARLSAESLSRLIPYLRLPNRETNQQKHLTFAESLELIYSCGTLGGLAGRPESAREWIVALHKREEALKASLEEQRRIAAEDPEESVHARGLEDNQRLFENLQAIRPALAELVKVHDILLNDGSLSFLWAAIERFMLDWVLLPPCSTPVLPILINEMEPLLLLSEVGAGGKPEETYKMTGLPALRMIRKTLDRIRVRVGQFGEPRIYIGTIEGAVGLTFDAARIIGLCEGAWPSRPPVDSILPDIDRIYLEPSYGQSNGQDSQDKNDEQIIPRRDDRPLYQLCAFYRVIQGVRTRIVLSFARQSVDGTIKEPSSIYLEVATALRRSVCGKPASSVPSLKDLRLGYFIPAREAGLSPPALSDFTTCRQVAGRTTPTDALVPYTWKSPSGMSTDIFRMRELILYARSGIIGPQDGILPPEWPLPRLLGLENQSPLSASRIKRFLTCPYWFFLQDMLHWKEPPSAPLTREVGQPAYGNLLHRVAEAFFKQYGVEFTSRRRSLAEWKKEAVAVIDREFDLFLNEYPLLSGLVRDQERKRLARDFRRLIEYEWHERKELRFRKAEFRYGYPEPLFLDLDGRKFFVRGFIDRLDDAGGRILVRDIKSGKGRPREGKDKSPDPVLDVQLALYGLVMDAIHKIDPANWPEVGGVAYFYLDPRGASERTFEEDLYDLLEKGRIWLSTLADMIKAHIFPRTVISNDCTYCPFVPVCGDQANGAAAEKLQDAGDILKKYLSLKMKEESEAEEIEL